MREVSKAKLTGDMGSLGQASNKLIRQFKFPFRYEENEKMAQADHDRMFGWDYEHTRSAFDRHMQTGECGLPQWCQKVSGKQVLALLEELFKVDESYPDLKWTGFRITGTVNRSNGYPVYSLWLFAKREGSATKVYSGKNAPNVESSHDVFGMLHLGAKEKAMMAKHVSQECGDRYYDEDES